MYGLSGRILHVDLSRESMHVEELPVETLRRFVGGNGLAAFLIGRDVDPVVQPFDQENMVVFAVGPLSGTPVWGTSRGHMASISPLTGLFADSNYGGAFGLAHKRTGFDAIAVRGCASSPVYLRVTPEGGELLPAEDLWGKTTEETNAILADRDGKGAVSISIGQAGENCVLFANLVCGGTRPGAAGRGGLGAVLGGKRLKAIVASGGERPNVAFPDKLREFLRSEVGLVREKAAPLTNFGTPILVEMINEKGLLCTHNAAVETFASAATLGPDAMDPYIQRNTACPGCPIACGKDVSMPGAKAAAGTAKMPEYETIYALGSMLDMTSIEPVIRANALCDLLGLDTISMGVTLAFVAECLERGIVTADDLGGQIGFNDAEGMVRAVEQTAGREGLGDMLAEGSVRLAERFGGNAHQLLYAVKGLEIAGHSARGLRPLALGYATATRGGSHHDTRPKYLFPETDPGFEGQPEYSVRSQNFTALGDSLVLCRFIEERLIGSENNDKLAELLNLVTDWGVTGEELETAGERIYNLERQINVGRGASREQDVLPWRTMHEPIPDGPAKGRYCPPEQLAALLDEYYALRGWDADGRPTRKTLVRLGLEE